MSGFSKIQPVTAWLSVVSIVIDEASILSVLGLQVHSDGDDDQRLEVAQKKLAFAKMQSDAISPFCVGRDIEEKIVDHMNRQLVQSAIKQAIGKGLQQCDCGSKLNVDELADAVYDGLCSRFGNVFQTLESIGMGQIFDELHWFKKMVNYLKFMKV